jgi:hypothetical protein
LDDCEEIVEGTEANNPDTDGDGCRDGDELGTDETTGGRRDPTDYWDFFDVWTPDPLRPNTFIRDGAVQIEDVLAIAGRFATSGAPSAAGEWAPPSSVSGYHPAYDRGPIVGPNDWSLGPADGAITLDEIFDAVAQFAHRCL